MKKTAFLLVLALLLQILLPPSMAGNVYAASTEEGAQTQAADGDQLKSLYDTYYLGACKKQVITIICGMDMRLNCI